MYRPILFNVCCTIKQINNNKNNMDICMGFTKVNKVILACSFFTLFSPITSIASDNNVLKVGVRAIFGITETEKQWSKTIDVLNSQIKTHRFKLEPILGFQEMRVAVENKKIDFILTNPLAYTELSKQSGITRLLTLNKKQPNGIASTEFSSAIFTRSDRDDINYLKDAKNKSIIGVHQEAFGGWRMALREFIHNDIDIHKYASKVIYTSDNTHNSVINAVLNGNADIGVVRTGIIELLAAQGKIKLTDIKVLNLQKDSLPALHSTQLYPEWPFAVMPHISSEISGKVFHSLLSIKPTSAAAISGKYFNWTAPLDYSEVYSLVDELSHQDITFVKIWNKHWIIMMLILAFASLIIFYTIYLFSINKKLTLSQKELNQHRHHLKEIVDKKTAELYIEKAAAEKANKAKSEFLSSMSHELRTPLSAILGFSQLIKLQEPKNKRISLNVDEIMSAGDYLLSLINEILDLAKIESGAIDFELEKVSCTDVLQTSLNIVAPLMESNNISFNITSPDECFVTADYKRLQQTCINLLSNAIKYNKQNGHIDIKLERHNQQCKLRFKDYGVGIKPEFYDKVFLPFARDEEKSELIEGTGVGLVITKNIIEHMKGEIGFNSEYGKGSEFWVTLPTATP